MDTYSYRQQIPDTRKRERESGKRQQKLIPIDTSVFSFLLRRKGNKKGGVVRLVRLQNFLRYENSSMSLSLETSPCLFFPSEGFVGLMISCQRRVSQFHYTSTHGSPQTHTESASHHVFLAPPKRRRRGGSLCTSTNPTQALPIQVDDLSPTLAFFSRGEGISSSFSEEKRERDDK